MNRPGGRAWRFVHPDFPSEDQGSVLETGSFGPGLQLTARGSIALVSGADAVRQALLLLLTTVPGERVMRPAYGCELFRLVFSPNDAATAGLAIHYVQRAIERWEPRVETIRVDALPNPENPVLLEILLEYRLKGTQDVDQMRFSLNLQEGETYATAFA
jgi:uncharacterized protein